MARKSYINRLKPCTSSEDIRTQGIREPKHSVAGKEQHALARVMTLSDVPYLVIAFANTNISFGIHIRFTIRSTIHGPCPVRLWLQHAWYVGTWVPAHRLLRRARQLDCHDSL